jgi:hypothetical protein
LFWPLIALGLLAEAIAGAFFGIAAFSGPTPHGSATLRADIDGGVRTAGLAFLVG